MYLLHTNNSGKNIPRWRRHPSSKTVGYRLVQWSANIINWLSPRGPRLSVGFVTHVLTRPLQVRHIMMNSTLKFQPNSTFWLTIKYTTTKIGMVEQYQIFLRSSPAVNVALIFSIFSCLQLMKEQTIIKLRSRQRKT